jgi:hypothetical protein
VHWTADAQLTLAAAIEPKVNCVWPIPGIKPVPPTTMIVPPAGGPAETEKFEIVTGIGVAVAVAVAVLVGVFVTVGVLVAVFVGVAVLVGVFVGVLLGVRVAVWVAVGD